jgi:hypothetical protein
MDYRYFIGGLVGALVMLMVGVLAANYLPPRKPNPEGQDLNNQLLGYWERVENRMDAQLLVWQGIANSVATWEQRYLKRKGVKAHENEK